MKGQLNPESTVLKVLPCFTSRWPMFACSVIFAKISWNAFLVTHLFILWYFYGDTVNLLFMILNSKEPAKTYFVSQSRGTSPV